MQRNDAHTFMVRTLELDVPTATKKLDEAIRNPGSRIEVTAQFTVSAVQPRDPGHKWDFTFHAKR